MRAGRRDTAGNTTNSSLVDEYYATYGAGEGIGRTRGYFRTYSNMGLGLAAELTLQGRLKSLPLGYNIAKNHRGVGSAAAQQARALCPCCGAAPETEIHLFAECPAYAHLRRQLEADLRVQCPARWQVYARLATPKERAQALLKPDSWLHAETAPARASTPPGHTLAAQTRRTHAARQSQARVPHSRRPTQSPVHTQSTPPASQPEPAHQPPAGPSGHCSPRNGPSLAPVRMQTRATTTRQARLQRAVSCRLATRTMATKYTPLPQQALLHAHSPVTSTPAHIPQPTPSPPLPTPSPQPTAPEPRPPRRPTHRTHAMHTRAQAAANSSMPHGVTHTTSTRRTTRPSARALGPNVADALISSPQLRQRDSPRPTLRPPQPLVPPTQPSTQTLTPPPGPLPAMQAPNPPPRPLTPPPPSRHPPAVMMGLQRRCEALLCI